MIDKITAKIKRYPFQTGIIIGVAACLLLVGFFSLFQDHGRTLSGNSEIIQEDYLRMSINEYSQNHDDDLAAWRYSHLGNKADTVLKYMKADESVSPYALAEFAEAVDKTDKIGGTRVQKQSPEGTPTNPRKGLSGVGKTLLIIFGILVAAAAVLYVVSLIQTKNKQKRRNEKTPKFEDDSVNMITPDKARSVQDNSPDTLFDLDSLFPQNDEEQSEAPAPETADMEQESGNDRSGSFETEEKPEESSEPASEPEPDVDGSESNENSDDGTAAVSDFENKTSDEESSQKPEPDAEAESESESEKQVSEDDINDVKPQTEENEDDINTASEQAEPVQESKVYSGLEYESSSHSFNGGEDAGSESVIPEESDNHKETENTKEASFPLDIPVKTVEIAGENPGPSENSEIEPEIKDNAEKPLVETDPENEAESEDELLKMIRAGKNNAEEQVSKNIETEPESPESREEITEETAAPDPEYREETAHPASPDGFENPGSEKSDDDILIHYQSQYRIGNDMYDEVFSIDQGDVFRGECGIGIGETLNNTDPKAVTAFEVWLFDKDDIHTATWYLMSDFALSNEGISQRLAQRGKCDRIRRGDLYTLETETLVVEIKILELEYGNEMEEKNSYFTNVVFDVIARQKKAE